MEFTLVLTHACNLACHYCYMGPKTERHMPLETARQALRWAFDHFQPADEKERLQIGYFGGEPLLVWDLLRDCHLYAEELARARGLPCPQRFIATFTTNGTLLTPEIMDWCAEHGLVVALSLDGVRESHDATRRFRSGESSFDAALRGLDVALARAGLTETITVVDPANVRWLSDGVRFIYDRGVRVASFSLNYSATWDEPLLAVYSAELEKAGDEFLRRFRNGEDVYLAALDAKIVGRLKRGLKPCDKCTFGVGEIAVAPSGNLYPCERLVGNDRDLTWSIGHISTGVDAVRLEPLNRRRTAPDPLCQTCALRDRCMNFCGCSNVFSAGDVARPGAALCLAEQIHARVADRVAKTLFWEGNPVFLRKFYYEDGRDVPAPAHAAPAASLSQT